MSSVSNLTPKFETSIADMLYGFGDQWPSNKETIKLVDILAQQYIHDITTRAVEVAELRGSVLDKDCFLYVVRQDKPKFARAQYLLKKNEEIKEAKTLNEVDIESEAFKKRAKLMVDEIKES